MDNKRLDILIARIKESGDETAFAEFYELTSKGLFSYLLSIVRRREVAEDLMQDTYVRFRQSVQSYKSGNPAAFLIEIGKNIAFNHIKRAKYETATDFSEWEPVSGEKSVEDLADTMRAAFRIAQSGRKGPVLVDIPKDITAAVCEFTPKKPEPIRTVTTFNEEQVKWAAEIINGAQRPLVYFGGGVRSAASCQPLRDLLKKAEIPATYTLMAAGVVPYGDPMNIGMVGMHGCYTSNRAVADCDVLIAVGTRFSDRVALNPKTFAKNATIIQIDIDPSELGKNVEVDLSIVGDAAYVLNAMLPQIEEKKHPDWMKMIHEWQAQDYHPVSDPTRLMPHQVIGEVCNQCGPEAVYVTDVGQHQMWAAQYLRHAKSRGFITSGGLGTMGFGYGAAIGAQMALGRDQRVVMFTGDGSFHMNLNEACTAVSYELPIITVIFNNSVLGMVRQWQNIFYEKRYSQTDPHRKTDFVKLAEGFGLKGYRCRNLPEFQAAFADAMKQKGPTWIECIIDKDEKVLPMIPGGGDINDIIME